MSWKDPRCGKFQVWKKIFWFFCPTFLPEIKRCNPQHRIFHEFGKYEYHFWRQGDSSKRYFLMTSFRSLSLFNCIFPISFLEKFFTPLKVFYPPPPPRLHSIIHLPHICRKEEFYRILDDYDQLKVFSSNWGGKKLVG